MLFFPDIILRLKLFLKASDRYALIAFALMAVSSGIFFRFYSIDEKIFWHDEVYTQIFAAGYSSADWQKTAYTGGVFNAEDLQYFRKFNPEKSVFDTITGLAADEPQNPPLYFLMARIWTVIFGEGTGTLRLLSVFISLFTLPAMYYFLKELSGNKNTSLIGSSLIFVSPFFTIYSREARSYILWTVLILFGFALLLRSIRLTETRKSHFRVFSSWFFFSLFTSASMYASLSTSAVILAELIFIAVRENFKFTRISVLYSISMIFSGILFFPWMLVILFNFQAVLASTAWSSVIQVPRSEILFSFALNLSRVFFDFQNFNYAVIPAALFFIAFTVHAFAILIRRNPAEFLPVFLMALIPVLLLLGPDLFPGGIRSLSSRYFIPVWISVICAAAYSLEHSLQRRYGFLLIAVFFAAGISGNWLNTPGSDLRTKSLSSRLPEAAKIFNKNKNTLIVCNREVHNPGNILALSSMLREETKLQFPPFDAEYRLPEGFRHVYLFGANLPFRKKIMKNENVRLKSVMEDVFIQIWEVDFSDSDGIASSGP